MSILTMLVLMAMLATIVALFIGLGSMAHGGDFDLKHDAQFMSVRVGLHALTLLLLVIAFVFS